ncbi:hypothetical protein O7632_22975 [Solwaraspora sp. WMMD406]|nr:hypothetical protein [Solwaraspora sp. WMMD406]MDG4766941.1 hypothetical protein [Solwaraspora sp. WMMD406]
MPSAMWVSPPYGRRRVLYPTGGSFVGGRLSGTVVTGGMGLEL